jgi:hypothetical protein
MTEQFEFISRLINRKFIFRRNPILPDFASCDAFYENPKFGLQIGFDIVMTREDINTNGRIEQIKVTVGAVLIDGSLKSAIQRAGSAALSADDADAITKDIYELIIRHTPTHWDYDLRRTASPGASHGPSETSRRHARRVL